MARRSWLVIKLVSLLSYASFCLCTFATAEAQKSGDGIDKGKLASANKYAILVGCTKYDNLGTEYYLKGPANDVELFRDLLISRFDFPKANVVTLSEARESPVFRPTRANIEREFKQLAKLATAGDQIVILLAGHGTQQPNNDPLDLYDPEPDGLDEVFLPADSAPWSPSQKTIVNAIVDDQLRQWLGAIRKLDRSEGGASVWVIIDACHSGTMLRAAGQERMRQIPPELLIPNEEMNRIGVASRGGNTRAFADDEMQGLAAQSLGGAAGELVAMYAAQSTEPTVERLLPYDAEPAQQRAYGLLSFTINQILTRATAPLTYRELTLRVQQQYTAWGRSFPTPLIESTPLTVGDGADREVLGTRQWPERSRVTLKREGGKFKLNAGALFGATTGSILAIYPPAGDLALDKPVGHVRVTAHTALDSDVTPCEYEGHPRVDSLPTGSRAELVYIDSGLQPLNIAFDENAAALQTEILKAIRTNVERPDQFIRFVSRPEEASWLVQVSNEGALLVPATGWVNRERSLAARQTPLSSVFGPYVRDVQLASRLGESLVKIARAHQLLSLSEPVDGGRIASGVVNVQLNLCRYAGTSDSKGTPVDLGQGAIKLEDGNLLGFKIENKGRTDADVTLLYIDENYGIRSWFPKAGTVTDNRLRPGASIGPPDIPRAELEPGTFGTQHLVLIAVRGEEQPQSFAWLEQPSIQKVRDIGGIRGSLEADLARLFTSALYGVGNVRGMREKRAADHSIRAISWQFK